MAHVSHVSDKKNINVACPDGFANQLRLLLAGTFLRLSGNIDSFNQEWILNNHNNVNFLDYFIPLPKVTMDKIDLSSTEADQIVTSCSFKAMIETLTDKKQEHIPWSNALTLALKYLKLRPEIKELIDLYKEKHDIKNCLGLHVRRTCKTAILNNQDKYRLPNSMISNEEILRLTEEYDKVYLATDNKETQKWFQKRLQDKLLVFSEIESGDEKFDNYYDRDLVKRFTTPLHTIIDFFMLKECGTFLGTSESSLSLIIWLWRNNKDDYPVFGRL